MTQDNTQAHDFAPEVIAQEDKAARQTSQFDNPNPDYGNAPRIPDAPSADPVNQDPPAPLSKRDQIAADHKARRAAAEAEAGEMVQNEMGEYVPPFVVKQEQEAAEAAAAKAAEQNKPAEPPKPYTLKVFGNDVPVKDRAELAKLAEVEEDEAADYSDAALIRLAQKQMAANALLDEAKATKKLARTAPRETDDTLSDPDAADDYNTDPDETADALQTPPNDRTARQRELIEKIQFGDAEEAASALNDAVAEGVRQTMQEQKFQTRYDNAKAIIQKASSDFEAANADLVQDHDFADLVYNRAFVSEVKKDLLAAGLKSENVERVVGNDVRTAMNAYLTVAADGRVKVRNPHQMFAAAAASVRSKFNRPAAPRPGTQQPAARPTPSLNVRGRVDAKRALTPQPARASVPRSVPQVSGQAPAARSNVVLNMRKARGQA